MSTTYRVAAELSRPFGSVSFGFLHHLRSAVKRRRTLQSLHHLSDRQLTDIGLVRAEVDAFAHITIVPFIP